MAPQDIPPSSLSDASTQEALRAWGDILANTPVHIRATVQSVVESQAQVLSDRFYESLQDSPRSGQFLDPMVVEVRLRHSMRLWLTELFCMAPEGGLEAAVERQRRIGALHARIRLPIDLMAMGMRVLQRSIRAALSQTSLDSSEQLLAQLFVSDLLHLADGLMNQAYFHDTRWLAHRDEAYKAISQRRSASYERARQRAALSEWAESALMSVWTRERPAQVCRLRDSDFGVWLHHKGAMLFGDSPELRELIESVDTMDNTLLPRLKDKDAGEARQRAVMAIKALLDLIRLLVSELFDRALSLDDGLDVETHLPDRRYLPVILGSEMRNHTHSGRPCCLLMLQVRLPALDSVSATGSRQRWLEAAAGVLARCARSSDHLFRYDEDRFLLLAVECDRSRAMALADDIASELGNTMQAANVQGSWTPTPAGVKIGIAEYDRHPDYRYFIQRAESALAQASSSTPAQVAFA